MDRVLDYYSGKELSYDLIIKVLCLVFYINLTANGQSCHDDKDDKHPLTIPCLQLPSAQEPVDTFSGDKGGGPCCPGLFRTFVSVLRRGCGDPHPQAACFHGPKRKEGALTFLTSWAKSVQSRGGSPSSGRVQVSRAEPWPMTRMTPVVEGKHPESEQARRMPLIRRWPQSGWVE